MPQRTQAVLLSWSLTSCSVSYFPAWIYNSWPPIINLASLRHLGCLWESERDGPHPQIACKIVGRNVYLAHWTTGRQYCRSHSRSSAVGTQLQPPCRQNRSARPLPLLWNQTPCFRHESIVPNNCCFAEFWQKNAWEKHWKRECWHLGSYKNSFNYHVQQMCLKTKG